MAIFAIKYSHLFFLIWLLILIMERQWMSSTSIVT